MTDLSSSTRTGTLVLNASYPWFQIWHFLFKPRVSIDGAPAQGTSWGSTSMQLPAGSHSVAVSINFYWFLPISKATTTVTVPADGSVTLDYRASWLAFPGVGGSLTQA